MLPRTSADRAACIDNPGQFQHELLAGPPSARPGGERQREAIAGRSGRSHLRVLPLFNSCLYDAIVTHDVAGFVAGTMEGQRAQIRAALGVKVEPDDFDTLAGLVRGNRQVNHEEVLRLRQANPHESLEVLAMRLGCSLSTVKRHMRRARNSAEVKLAVVKPTMERVLAAFAAVTRPARPRERRVA